MALGGGDDGFLAREHQAHRPARLHRHQRQHALVDHVLLAAEAAADGAHDEPHLVDRLRDDARQHVAVVRDVLAGREDGDDAVVIDVGEAGLRLEIGVLDLLGGVDLLDDQIGFGEALLDVADADRDVLDDVVGRVVVQHRGAGPHRLVGIEHCRQRLVDDLDFRQRAPRDQRVFGCDRRHLLADVAHLAARHDRLVVHEHAEVVDARHVGTGDDALDARHGLGFRRVDRDDAGVRVRAAQHGHVQHVRHHHVAGIFERARHLARRIEPPHVGADEGAVGRFVLGERARRSAAVIDVAGQFDRVENLLVAGAAADVAAEALLDLLAVRERIGAQRGGGGHDHAGDAVAALAGARLVERLLQHGQLARFAQAFHGLDRGALGFRHGNQAGLQQHAVDEHRAGAAFAGAAAFLGAGVAEIVAQEVEQAQVRLGGARNLAAVDGCLDAKVRHRPPPVRGQA